MHTHRINELLELLQPYWLKNKELSLLEVLDLIRKEAAFEQPVEKLTDEVLIYHLKMAQIGKDEMIPGIKKDFEDDFKNALLKARGVLK
ncbi:hypothetical protein PCNPT3_12870 [Psychromonas sp. CNPT3]|uniref:YihD family protein n=1 Tax=Psychromonas sp. CNPT3 TaxID=314282 RepID=UPI00006E4866|nr:YihD family protein [Psychromonas sp. CNPT3]AGH82510.1 hypothetical protein PCNPT3_12870 [Psychromonas sp. CNPT3]